MQKMVEGDKWELYIPSKFIVVPCFLDTTRRVISNHVFCVQVSLRMANVARHLKSLGIRHSSLQLK